MIAGENVVTKHHLPGSSGKATAKHTRIKHTLGRGEGPIGYPEGKCKTAFLFNSCSIAVMGHFVPVWRAPNNPEIIKIGGKLGMD